MSTPNVTPDLAEKVLGADIRNAIKTVSDGGTLPAPHRKMMQEIALTPELASQQRAAALLAKYCSGQDLTPAQWEEIRTAHPAFNQEPVPPSVASAPELELTPEPSPANGDGEITKSQFARWTALYGTEHRQLRRWIKQGKSNNDPCPLDYPEQMAGWVERNMKKIRGDLLERIAAACSKIPAKSQTIEQQPEASSEDTGEICSKTEPPPEKPNTETSAQKMQPLDLATVGGVEGESVEFFRRLFSATKQQLEEAYKDGTETRIAQLHKRLESTGESLRKHEAAAELKAKKRGDLIDKALVLNEITQALELLKMMRENSETALRDALLAGKCDPPLTPEQVEIVLRISRETRMREDDILRNISSFKTTDDVRFALAS